eukprot:TRINITY_DN9971_c0_g1_i2.p1 TRINITY_DN9971_c0_g1~~TRINITY_DN9971_c0_g1_i2.p1  ORF type:complete len:212 (-),score=27.56 TRINITY_DN9971_c0_g1_i2:175-810(-)
MAKCISFEKFDEQQSRWPASGKHILAQYDDDAVLVYQAYNAEIGRYAVENQRFGGPHFNLHRTTWIKTNFLWMMFRSGWGTKPNQEVTLAIWLKRAAFETILSEAVIASEQGDSKASVVLQWDPDHLPSGAKHPGRRAVQLGLRGRTSFSSGDDIVAIMDISEFVAEQRQRLPTADGAASDLLTPLETVYTPSNEAVVQRIGLSPWPETQS